MATPAKTTPAKTTPAERLDKITQDQLCIGCGLCASFAGEDAIGFGMNDEGDLIPFARDGLTDPLMDQVEQMCPSLRVEGLPQDLIDTSPHHDLVWGAYHGLKTGHAGDATLRHIGSTAGVLTAIGCYLLASHQVDFIAHVKAPDHDDDNPPHHGVATVSTTEDEVIAAAGSRYGPTAPLINIMALLDRGQPFALIAKPCDLNAMRNLAHLDERVNRLIKYWLTPVCGGFSPDEGYQQFLDRHAIPKDEVKALRYRGYGCPGPTQLTMASGETNDIHYLDFWGDDESHWVLPLRCKICPDGIGEGADLAASDTWDGGSPDRVESETDLGLNHMIIRTKQGMDLVKDAVKAGYLTITKEAEIEDLNRTQPHQVKKKYAGLARAHGLAEAGSVAPALVNIRAEALSDAAGDDAYHHEKQGTMKRALAIKPS